MECKHLKNRRDQNSNWNKHRSICAYWYILQTPIKVRWAVHVSFNFYSLLLIKHKTQHVFKLIYTEWKKFDNNICLNYLFSLTYCGYAYHMHHFAPKISCTCSKGVLPVLPVYAFWKLISKQKRNIFLVRKKIMGLRIGLPQNDRHRAIEMLEGEMTEDDVSVLINVHRTTIWSLV